MYAINVEIDRRSIFQTYARKGVRENLWMFDTV